MSNAHTTFSQCFYSRNYQVVFWKKKKCIICILMIHLLKKSLYMFYFRIQQLLVYILLRRYNHEISESIILSKWKFITLIAQFNFDDTSVRALATRLPNSRVSIFFVHQVLIRVQCTRVRTFQLTNQKGRKQ